VSASGTAIEEARSAGRHAEGKSPTWRIEITILLIDDECVVREVLSLLMTSLGHTVIQSGSGAEGLARLEAGDAVDLVLTDLKMPGLSGWDVVSLVRQRWPNLRVGVVSGNLEAMGERRHPVDLVITKPVGRDRLKTLLDPLLQA